MSEEQNQYKEHMQFGEDHPAWAQMALSVINTWGRAERTLAHAIGEALMEAYRMGQEGETPVYVPLTAPTVLRRSRAVPEPAPATRVFRRSR